MERIIELLNKIVADQFELLSAFNALSDVDKRHYLPKVTAQLEAAQKQIEEIQKMIGK